MTPVCPFLVILSLDHKVLARCKHFEAAIRVEKASGQSVMIGSVVGANHQQRAASSAEAHLLSPLLTRQALNTLESPIQLPAASSHHAPLRSRSHQQPKERRWEVVGWQEVL